MSQNYRCSVCNSVNNYGSCDCSISEIITTIEGRTSSFPPPKVNDAGLKYDSGKPAMSLIPPDSLLEVGKVMEYGANKYAKHNWYKGIRYTRLLDAAERHVAKFKSPNHTDSDEESSLHHLAHACVNLLMCLQFVLEGRSDLDDRIKK